MATSAAISRWRVVSLFMVVLIAPRVAESAEVVDIGSQRELFVDRFLIDKLTGTRLELQRPRSAEVAIRYDKPWEDVFAFYTTVFQDGSKYRMYYRGRYRKDGTPGCLTLAQARQRRPHEE
jgi:hypothetical protein